jgi:predicted AlkP superfamily phosphohydrolase/phosphomutase
MLDGGDHRLVSRWSKQGYLPTIARIIDRGCFKTVTGPDLIPDTGSWRAVLSGMSKCQNGFYSYRQLVPGTYTIKATDENVATDLPFWCYINDSKTKVAIIDPPDFTVSPEVSGIQLANWAGLRTELFVRPPASVPPALLGEVYARFGEGEKFLPYLPHTNIQNDLADAKRALRSIEKKGEVCRHLLSQGSFDLIVATFFEPHPISHRLWQEPDDNDPAKESIPVRDLYVAIDEEVGRILAELPADSNIFIVSAFGIKTIYPATGITEAFLRQLGYEVPASTDATTAGAPDLLALLRRAVPKRIRTAASQVLPSALQEKLIANDFANRSDWQRTKAFSIPHLYNSLIRINVRGREPQGIVEPGAEYEAVLDAIEADLKMLVDKKSGKPAVVRVVRTLSAFGCDINNPLPDLFVEWQPLNHFMEEVVHPKVRLVQEKGNYHRPSDHTSTGFLAAAGPAVRRSQTDGEIHALDLAPTLMTLLNLPVPEQMHGSVDRDLCAVPAMHGSKAT